MAELALDRHRGSDVGRTQQPAQVGDGHDQHAEHAVGAVDEGEPLLGGQLDRREPGRGERLGGRHQRAGRVADRALAHQRERAVGQRRQVAGAAERAVLVHHRRDAVRDQVGQQLRGLAAYAGVPGRQRREPQQHQRPDHLALHLGAGAGGVRADQRPLELGPHLGRDVPGGQCAEPGRDAVRRRGRGRELLDHLAGPVDRGQGGVAEHHRRTVAGDGHDVLGRERADVDGHRAGTRSGARSGWPWAHPNAAARAAARADAAVAVSDLETASRLVYGPSRRESRQRADESRGRSIVG